MKVFCLNQYDILNNSNLLEAIIQGLWNQKAYKEFDKLLSSLDLQMCIRDSYESFANYQKET